METDDCPPELFEFKEETQGASITFQKSEQPPTASNDPPPDLLRSSQETMQPSNEVEAIYIDKQFNKITMEDIQEHHSSEILSDPDAEPDRIIKTLDPEHHRQ